MAFVDQHWQRRWLGAGLAGVAAVLFPLRYLQVATIWDQPRGWEMQPDYIFAGCTTVVLMGVALLLARSARRAYERMEWRLDMLAGVNAPPHTSSQGTFSASHVPERHTIVQQIGPAERVIGWIYMLIFFVCALVTFAMLAVVLEMLINPAATVFHRDTVRAFGLLLAAPPMAFGLWVFGAGASDAWVPSPRFEIDQFSITWMRSRGRSVTIRWQEARLLEAATYYRVAGNRIERKEEYLLYGNDAVIRIDPELGNYREVRQLLQLITEHTSLIPCRLAQPGFRECIIRRFRQPNVER